MRPGRRRRRFAALIAASLLAAGCATAQADVEVANEDIGIGLPVVETAARPPVTTSTTVPENAPDSEPATTTTTTPPDPYRTYIATAKPQVTGLEVHDAPGGDPVPLAFPVPNPHQFGGPLTLMVTEGQPGDDWVRVQLPVRPNGQEAWIDTADYELSSTRIRAEVTLSSAQVRVFDGPTLIAESAAIVGAEDTPTPLGRFYVAAKKQNTPEEFWLGPWALVLSSFSEVLPTFSGGLPVIAIHGTNHPELMGEAITFGCVRVPNEVIEFLAEHVPIGAPVDIAT